MLTSQHNIIKHRRNWSIIYSCPEYTHYLKVGTSEQIESEVNLYQSAKSLGFSLPDLLWYEIETNDISWMKESVMAWLLYSDIFTNDCDINWQISNDHFMKFCTYQKKHLACQESSVGCNFITWWFKKQRDALRWEWCINHSIINELDHKIWVISESIPTVWNHGDHNPYNIFEEWFIDLEDSFMGPLWYDTITSLTQNFRFPIAGGELCQQHRFSTQQIREYIDIVLWDHLYLKNKDIFGALFIMRGIFVTVWSHAFPILQQFRYSRLWEAIEYFLQWWDMIEYFIDHYATHITQAP